MGDDHGSNGKRTTLDDAFAGLLRDLTDGLRQDLRTQGLQLNQYGSAIGSLDARVAAMDGRVGALEQHCIERHHRISNQIHALQSGIRNVEDMTGPHILVEKTTRTVKAATWKQIAFFVGLASAVLGLSAAVQRCGSKHAAGAVPVDMRR